MKSFHLFSVSEEFREGVFGQILIWLLESIHHMEKNYSDLKLSFDINALAYDNIIPTFIETKEKNNVFDEKINVKTYKLSNNATFDNNMKSFEIANKIWNKYFKFSDVIQKSVPEFETNCTLGIHYRGTDKNFDNGQTNYITQDEFILLVNDFLAKHSEITTIYCCSDEEIFIDNIRNTFKNLDIVQYNQTRSANTNQAFFRNGYIVDKNIKDNLTISAFVDMVALSKCKYVIKTSSALSSFSKIIQPNLQIYSVSAMKQPWFPTATIPVYQTDSKEASHILIRTLQNHVV